MKLAIIGSALAGGGVQIVDILLEDSPSSGLRLYDDSENAQGCDVLGVPVVGTLERILPEFHDGLIDSAVIAVGSIAPRKALFEKFIASGLHFPNIISSKSIVSSSVILGIGNVILPNVYLGPRVIVGNNNYFTTMTTVNHDTCIGSHCYFSTSVAVAGRVTISDCIRFDTSCSVTADAVVPTGALIAAGESFGPSRGL